MIGSTRRDTSAPHKSARSSRTSAAAKSGDSAAGVRSPSRYLATCSMPTTLIASPTTGGGSPSRPRTPMATANSRLAAASHGSRAST